jgi:hypothetical protein
MIFFVQMSIMSPQSWVPSTSTTPPVVRGIMTLRFAKVVIVSTNLLLAVSSTAGFWLPLNPAVSCASKLCDDEDVVTALTDPRMYE